MFISNQKNSEICQETKIRKDMIVKLDLKNFKWKNFSGRSNFYFGNHLKMGSFKK